MATTYTPNFSMPMMGMDDPHDQTLVNDAIRIADRQIAIAQQGGFELSLLDNNHFPEAINQRGRTETTAWQYCLDRWVARATGVSIATDDTGLHINTDSTSNVYLYQKIKIPSAKMLGKTYTLAICDGAGNVACKAITLPGAEPTSWQTLDSVSVGNAYANIIHTGSGEHGFCVSIGRTASTTEEIVIAWVDLYPGAYTLSTLPRHQQRQHVVEELECQRYFRTYATSAARPANGLDCSPPMRIDAPTQGTISVGGVTRYYNAADL